MSSEEQRLESKIHYFEDMMFRCKGYFDSRAGKCTDGLYPTVTIRQIMWALKMKPIQRQRWETCFDRREI